MTADILLCEFYMFLKEQLFSQLCLLVENFHKNCLGSLHGQMPLGCPAIGHQILLLSIAFFPKRWQSSCSHIAKSIFSSPKWLHKILPAQKAFFVSAHELLFFLSCRHELEAWLNYATFFFFFNWWSVATGAKRKLNQTREKAAPQHDL